MVTPRVLPLIAPIPLSLEISSQSSFVNSLIAFPQRFFLMIPVIKAVPPSRAAAVADR